MIATLISPYKVTGLYRLVSEKAIGFLLDFLDGIYDGAD